MSMRMEMSRIVTLLSQTRCERRQIKCEEICGAEIGRLRLRGLRDRMFAGAMPQLHILTRSHVMLDTRVNGINMLQGYVV